MAKRVTRVQLGGETLSNVGPPSGSPITGFTPYVKKPARFIVEVLHTDVPEFFKWWYKKIVGWFLSVMEVITKPFSDGERYVSFEEMCDVHQYDSHQEVIVQLKEMLSAMKDVRQDRLAVYDEDEIIIVNKALNGTPWGEE